MIRGYCETCGNWAIQGEVMPCCSDKDDTPHAGCGLLKDHLQETVDRRVTFEDARKRLIDQAKAAEAPMWFEADPEASEDTSRPIKSTGGSTSYYEIPEGATELNDLVEHKGMGFARGNIFKACYRIGEKAGTDVLYDIEKIIYFAGRMKLAVSKGQHV